MRILIMFLILISFSCKSEDDKLRHYNKQLTKLQKTEKYIIVRKLALDTLQNWINSGITATGIIPLKTFVKWKIDDALFFNSSQNKCVLLILETDQTVNAKLDFVKILLAVYEGSKWNFYFKSLPTIFFQRDFSSGKGFDYESLSVLSRKAVLREYYKKIRLKSTISFLITTSQF